MAYEAMYTQHIDEGLLKIRIMDYLKKFESGTIINSGVIVRDFKKPKHKGATIIICTVSEVRQALNKLCFEKKVLKLKTGAYKIL